MNRFEKTKLDKMKEMLGEFAPLLMNKLVELGFFDAPASISHHGNNPGGLFQHSFNVAEILLKLTEQNQLKWQRPESPAVIGFLHDLCKCDNYICVIDEEPIELFGGKTKGGQVHWEHNPELQFTGHGDKSVMMASTLLQLTEEEMNCIRYHMGAFTDKAEWAYYTRAIHRFPNVLWVHHADMIAAHILEVGSEWHG